jgi:hypothetical protein
MFWKRIFRQTAINQSSEKGAGFRGLNKRDLIVGLSGMGLWAAGSTSHGYGENLVSSRLDQSQEDEFSILKTVVSLGEKRSWNRKNLCFCLGYWAAGDGGGGLFKWERYSTHEPDGSIVIEAVSDDGVKGVWVRQNLDSEVNVRWFGAKGDGKADDTRSFSAAIAFLVGFGIDVAQPYSGNRPALYIPGGIYRLRPLPTIRGTQSIRIRGDGVSGTKLILVPNLRNPQQGLFQLGEFKGDPQNNWAGDAQGFDLSDMYLGCERQGNDDNKAPRYGFGVKDNGSGSLNLRRVKFWGFEYGVVSPYGSDFSRISDCDFTYNKVGVYLGPGSQQVSLNRLKFDRNGTAVVLDAVPQGDIQSCYFMDQNENDIVFEYSASKRTRLNVKASQKLYKGMFSIKDCWFETGTAEDVGSLKAHLHSTKSFDGSMDGGPSCILVQRIFLVSGLRNMRRRGQTFFWLCESGSGNRIEDLTVWGDYITDVLNTDGDARVKVSGINRHV